jgi:hypothetical protein
MSEKTSCNKRARTSSYGEAVRIESIDWKDLSESSGQPSKSLLQIIEKAFGKVRKKFRARSKRDYTRVFYIIHFERLYIHPLIIIHLYTYFTHTHVHARHGTGWPRNRRGNKRTESERDERQASSVG